MPASTILQPRLAAPMGIAGAVVTLNLDIALGRWTHSSQGVGGSGESAALVPESYEIARAYLVTMSLRCRESLWPQLHAMLAWGQRTSQPITFRFSQDDALTEYLMYLWSPRLPEAIRAEPDDFVGAVRTQVTWRTIANVIPAVFPWAGAPTGVVASVIVSPAALPLRL